MPSVAIDLHAHSSYAGGVGSICLEEVDRTVPLKGIRVIGTGDIQFPPWFQKIQQQLHPVCDGLYQLSESSLTAFLLQTEIIFTAKFGAKSKQCHVIVLFPTFDSVTKFYSLLEKWNAAVKTLGRPFVVCSSSEEVGQRINQIMDIDNYVELFPAHVLTPQGIYGGSNILINHLEDFFDQSAERIRIIETGLSADPLLLGLIPELDNKTLLSNSDAHSLALNRIGREFSIIDSKEFTYYHIIDALRSHRVIMTAEFHPTEGRFFLTGHKAGKSLKNDPLKRKTQHNKDEYCYFSPKHTPEKNICPICSKQLTKGALQRALEIGVAQGVERQLNTVKPAQKFVYMIPLIEIIANAWQKKKPTGKNITKAYQEIIKLIGTEVELWKMSGECLTEKLANNIDPKLLTAIQAVKNGNFCYNPCGYDGVYGTLMIGKTCDFEDLKYISLHS